jgi:CRISPR-associated endonuclease/helicase Cas3
VFYAHSGNSSGFWDPLSSHLKDVANLASQFASSFGASEEAYLAGLLHDLGKYRIEFQKYLKKECDGGIDTHHAVYGAAYAFKQNLCGSAFSIAGHHAGLRNKNKLQELVSNPTYDLEKRIPSLINLLYDEIGNITDDISLPQFIGESELKLELYIRFLYSCLVDADYLDTEEHYSGRIRPVVKLKDICALILDRIMKEKESKPTQGNVNQIRHKIFEQCIEKSKQKPGFFSLTVPTGGGKTISGMTFALSHARQWELERVIVVIPYLSIIEQNAAEYHRILDPEDKGFVVEHHSAISIPENEKEREPSTMELAAENWDAPIIVTTSVQFIESLFASSPSQCRKLHNIAKSVVIMDEVQTLPTHLLNPLLNIMNELKENYGVSFLFMTATQPAFKFQPNVLSEGFKPGEVQEITEDTGHIFQALERVQYKREGVMTWASIAERMKISRQALCVVNVRRHAYELFNALRALVPDNEKDSIFHLSSAMCAEHRLHLLGEIKEPREGSIRDLLKRGLPCRVVSTQLIEAGVDVDFPLLFRALGPLDSIVQAAGRCNREGKPEKGQVVIFTPEDSSLPSGIYKTATGHTASTLNRIPLESIGTNSNIFADYFSGLFQMSSTDYDRRGETSIQEDRANLRFRDVSKKAKVIKEEGFPVIVPYGKGKKIIEQIRARPLDKDKPRFDRHDFRSLQRSMVNVRKRDYELLEHFHMIKPLLPNLEIYVIEEGCYHALLGLLIETRPTEDLCGV